MQVFASILLVIPLLLATAAPAAANSGADATRAPIAASFGPRSSNVHVIRNDNGGSVVGYAQAVSRLRQQNAQIVFAGRCASACTLFLAVESSRSCITPGTSFLFHRAYGARRDMNEWATDFMMSQYPGWVRSWIRSQGGLTSRVLRMDYAYASRHMRTCSAST
jgi:hypothetical protein